MAHFDLFESLLDYQRSYFRLRNYAATTHRSYLTDQLLVVFFLKAAYGVWTVSDVEQRHVIDAGGAARRVRCDHCS